MGMADNRLEQEGLDRVGLDRLRHAWERGEEGPGAVDGCGDTWERSSRTREETREQARTFTARRDAWGSRGWGRHDAEGAGMEVKGGGKSGGH